MQITHSLAVPQVLPFQGKPSKIGRQQADSIRFAAKKTGKGTYNLIGAVTLLAGALTAGFGLFGFQKHRPSPVEASLDRQAETAVRQARNGVLIDAGRNAMVNGAQRVITGKSASDEARERRDTAVEENLQARIEKSVLDMMATVANASPSPSDDGVIRRVSDQVKDSLEAARLTERDARLNPDSSVVGQTGRKLFRQLQGTHNAQPELNAQEKQLLMQYAETLLAVNPNAADKNQQRRDISVRFVNRIVGRYEPDNVQPTLVAINSLFDAVDAQRNLVDQQSAAQAKVLVLGGGLSALGALCLATAAGLIGARREEDGGASQR